MERSYCAVFDSKIMLNTNSWNRIRYTLYNPFYNLISKYFYPLRQQSIESLGLNKGDKVLILGAGTGLDLDHLSNDFSIFAIDITPSMIKKLNQRATELHLKVDSRVMDGSNLDFKDDHFDAVILHLIVAVIPDPVACLKETERVLKPGGKFTIMDKFVESGRSPSLVRKILNPITSFIATTVTRDIDELLQHTKLQKTYHNKLNSFFWLIQGEKADT